MKDYDLGVFMNAYRIDFGYGNVYVYNTDFKAYCFFGKTNQFSKAELKRMEEELI